MLEEMLFKSGEEAANMSANMTDIIAAVGSSSAAISLEYLDGTDSPYVLRAVCLTCEEAIFYTYAKLAEKIAWNCGVCGQVFKPFEGTSRGCGNYYLIERGDTRYTVEEWVGGWLNIDPESISVEIDGPGRT